MDDDSKATETQAPPSRVPNTEAPQSRQWICGRSATRTKTIASSPLTKSLRAIKRGEINGATIVWHPGMADWVPLCANAGFCAAPRATHRR